MLCPATEIDCSERFDDGASSGLLCRSRLEGSHTDLSALPTADLPRLLLVEKDAAMRVMLQKTLASDYCVEPVGDALEACQAAKVRPPALILIDLYFPGTDNLTLIRAIRADTNTAQMPIIILTVSLHKDVLLRCLSAGANNFLLKPFNTVELLACARFELQLRGTRAVSSAEALPLTR